MWYVDDEEGFGVAVESIQDGTDIFACCSHHKKDPHHETGESLLKKQKRSDFKTRTKDSKNGLALFGTVPPPKKLTIEQVSEIARCVAESISTINPDAVVVYDIQDEPSRNGTQRPFPFFHTHEPRFYAHLLEKMEPYTETIVYRALTSNQNSDEFQDWLDETVQDYNMKNIVLVGGCRQPDETILSVEEATSIISEKQSDLFMGGITIPERHRDRGDEHTRIFTKVSKGISFFTSQVVYNADNAIWMLRDYDVYCKEQNVSPIRIVFTFAPFGSESTVNFLRWLGVELPDGTVKRVLSRCNLKSRVNESMQICWENWKRILDASRRLKINVPIGFSVESVSKSKMEQDAAVQLFSDLKEEMDAYYQILNQIK